MTLLFLLATFSLGSGQAVLRFETPEACEQMKDRLMWLASRATPYVPFSVEVSGYCVPQ
jgi:hypothetical protein